MKIKSLLLVMSVVVIATLFLSSSVFAAAADVIKMQTKGLKTRKRYRSVYTQEAR